MYLVVDPRLHPGGEGIVVVVVVVVAGDPWSIPKQTFSQFRITIIINNNIAAYLVPVGFKDRT